jgi:uncharacterized membrane protein
MPTSKRPLRPVEKALLVVPLMAMTFMFLWERFGPSPPPRYTVTNLGKLGDTTVVHLNDNGDVAGVWVTMRRAGQNSWVSASQRPFIWSQGSVRFLSNKDGYPNAINNSGEVIGILLNSKMPERDLKSSSFLWSNGQLKDFDNLVGQGTSVADINNRGAVTGFVSSKPKSGQGFVWRNGKVQLIKTKDGSSFSPLSMNDQGDIVAEEPFYGDMSTYHSKPIVRFANGTYKRLADKTTVLSRININGEIVVKREKSCFIWKDGEEQVLFEDSDDKRLYDAEINNQGQVVGTIRNGNGAPITPCLFFNSRSYDLNTLLPKNSGWALSEVSAINNRGQIVGEGYFNNRRRFFLLTPQASVATGTP